MPYTATDAYPSPPGSTSKQPFSAYRAILRHPNLFFQFALRLPLESIIALYAIDKEFHYRLNKYSVSLIHDYAKYHAPLASHIFSWVLYPELCISDPMLRPMDGREWLARDVPGFRWIGMVLWRQRVVHSILTELALESHRVPVGTEGALMKYWAVMEMPSTAMREAFLQDKDIWTDDDIYNFALFHVKLDMRFTHPVIGSGTGALSYMLLTQKSLSVLWKVLTGRKKLDHNMLTDMMVRTWPMADLETDIHTWLDDEADNGVPRDEWGLMMKEDWHPDADRMDSAVDLIIDEGLRRDLNVLEHLMDMMIYGHANEKTGKNFNMPRLARSQDGRVEVVSAESPLTHFELQIFDMCVGGRSFIRLSENGVELTGRYWGPIYKRKRRT